MTAAAHIDCPLCDLAAAMWAQAATDAETGTDNTYCVSHGTRGWCDPCADLIDYAADTYDPDTGRSARPRRRTR